MDGAAESDDAHRHRIDVRIHRERDHPFTRMNHGAGPANSRGCGVRLVHQAKSRQLTDEGADGGPGEAAALNEGGAGERAVPMGSGEDGGEVAAPQILSAAALAHSAPCPICAGRKHSTIAEDLLAGRR
ncbi:hypothetical protein GCM10027404_18860 [Arthrobacter tumbae]